MKGRYAGSRMTIYGSLLPGAASIAHWATKVNGLSAKEQQRITVLDWHRGHRRNISLTARHFGLTRYTVRSWMRRFTARGMYGLRDQSHRPHHLRQVVTSWQVIDRIVAIRMEYPAWSKYKIQALLRSEGMGVSASTIGRILKRKGLINERVSQRRKRAALHPKARFPRGLKISCPGDLIQMDTKHIILTGGRKFYQFTAIDVLTKIRILKAYPSESSRHGAEFLQCCASSFSFPVKAVQTDNGAPFLKEFDRLCREKKLLHYFIYPRHPKQNSYVEASHGADEREFYRQGNLRSTLMALQEQLTQWQRTWNEIRPHAALSYLTPRAYLEKWQQSRLSTKDVITLQT